MNNFLFFVIFNLIFLSCKPSATRPEVINIQLPSNELTSIEVSTDSIKYQYYESYGFTDVCEHYRTLFKTNDKLDLSEWKPLPFSKADIHLINSFPNKIDSLSDTLYFPYKNKYFFRDIQNDSHEFLTDSLDYLVNLNGYYSYDSISYRIYYPEIRLFYEEFHICK